MRKILIAVILLLPLTGITRADEKNHKELVNQLFTIMNLKNGYNGSLEEMIDIQIETQPMLKPAKKALTDFFTKYVSWKIIKPELTELYMNEFTESELRDLVSFFSTPIGILWLEKSHDLSFKILEISQSIVNRHQEELSRMIAEEMTRHAEDATK